MNLTVSSNFTKSCVRVELYLEFELAAAKMSRGKNEMKMKYKFVRSDRKAAIRSASTLAAILSLESFSSLLTFVQKN